MVTKDLITMSSRGEQEGRVMRYNNFSKAGTYSLSLGFSTSPANLFLNTIGGYRHDRFFIPPRSDLYLNNDGGSFFGSAYIGANLFKNTASLNLSISYINPFITPVTKRYNRIMTNASFSINLFKNKVQVSAGYNDIIHSYYSWSKTVVRQKDYCQSTSTVMNIPRFYMSLAYIFGKEFNSNISIKSIDNNDINIKKDY